MDTPTPADINDSYTRTIELADSYERDAVLNENKADELEVEADRLRNVAKEKRAEAKKERDRAEDIAGNKKKAAK